VADDTPAVQAVLRADKKRAGLLEEETVILRELEAADAAEEAGRRGVSRFPPTASVQPHRESAALLALPSRPAGFARQSICSGHKPALKSLCPRPLSLQPPPPFPRPLPPFICSPAPARCPTRSAASVRTD